MFRRRHTSRVTVPHTPPHACGRPRPQPHVGLAPVCQAINRMHGKGRQRLVHFTTKLAHTPSTKRDDDCARHASAAVTPRPTHGAAGTWPGPGWRPPHGPPARDKWGTAPAGPARARRSPCSTWRGHTARTASRGARPCTPRTRGPLPRGRGATWLPGAPRLPVTAAQGLSGMRAHHTLRYTGAFLRVHR
jgi:hypothetical protein